MHSPARPPVDPLVDGLGGAPARNMLAVVVQDGALADGQAPAVTARLLDPAPADKQKATIM